MAPPMTSKEKRKHCRTPMRKKGVAFVGEGRQLEIATLDIAPGGTGVELAGGELIEVGAPITIYLEGHDFSAKGIVRWMEDSGDNRAILGIEFEKIDLSKP